SSFLLLSFSIILPYLIVDLKLCNRTACASLDDGFEDAFQYTVQGNSHNRLKSTNLIERLNQEVRRREKIIRIFPNQTSANRLIGAVLMDLHDEWIYSSRKYINFDK
ncbi:transposase, partial [Enterococcus faecium]|nr:transposase [Enterococcus faecium]